MVKSVAEELQQSIDGEMLSQLEDLELVQGSQFRDQNVVVRTCPCGTGLRCDIPVTRERMVQTYGPRTCLKEETCFVRVFLNKKLGEKT